MKLDINTNNIDLINLSEQDAIKLVSQIVSKFQWKGAFFNTDDIEYAVKTHNDNVEYHEKVTVEEVRNAPSWSRVMTDQLINEGLIVLDDAIYEAMNKKKRQDLDLTSPQ